MKGDKRSDSQGNARLGAGVLCVLLAWATTAEASIFKRFENAVNKVGQAVHDEGVSLGKELSKSADSAVQEIVKNGQVIGHAIVKGGKIVEEKTVQGGKVVGTEVLQGGQFLVKDGKIVGREVEIGGKIVGTEIIKDGKVVGHTVVQGGEYVVHEGQIVLAAPKPIPMPGDFPPPASGKTAEQRLADCKGANEPNCYTAVKMPLERGIPTNCIYGWNMGKGHPSDNKNPPAYDKLLNALDQCSWFHDRGAWRYNAVTHVCEKWEMCSNSMGLKRCLDRYQPKTKEEAAAKACFTGFFERIMGACVPSLYKDWGAQMQSDSKGDQWLTADSVAALRGAMKKCPSESGMKHPGFPGL